MLPPSSQQHAERGFTLVELLTVIAIIAILMGLLFPVTSSVMNNARKTQASSDMSRIIAAVMAYRTDYGKLPINADQLGGASPNNPQGPQDTVYGDPKGTYPNSYLFNILRAIPETATNTPKNGKGIENPNNVLNPRQVVYFQGQNVKNPNSPRSGFLTADFYDGNYQMPVGSLLDPWGDEYVVWMDATGDGDMTTSMGWFYTEYQGANPTWRWQQGLPTAAASMGPDYGFGTKGNGTLKGSDDVVSW